jgi:hypothetical protein
MNAILRPADTTGAGTDPSPMESPALARQNVQAPVSFLSKHALTTSRRDESHRQWLRRDAGSCPQDLQSEGAAGLAERTEVQRRLVPASWQSRLLANGIAALVLGCLLLAAYLWWRLLQ